MRYQKGPLRVLAAVAPFVFGCIAWSQATPPSDPQAASAQVLQQFSAQNTGQLRAYQWIETTSTSVQGHSMPAKKFICRFAPDGTLTRTPLDPQQNGSPQLKGGPLMRSMEKKKMAEVKEQMVQVHEVTAMYLPLNPAKLSEAIETHHVDFEHDPTSGDALSLSDYAKPADRLTFTLNSTTRQVQRIYVKTFLSGSDDPLNLTVQFSNLADGTTYPSVTTIEAPAKKISITTLSSDFSKPVQ
jgi:hypothetical protein